jgi:hypothetical protein
VAAAWLAAGLEGLCFKPLDEPYQPVRSWRTAVGPAACDLRSTQPGRIMKVGAVVDGSSRVDSGYQACRAAFAVFAELLRAGDSRARVRRTAG